MTKISVFLIDDNILFSQGVTSLVAGESQIDLLGYTNDPDLGKEKIAQLQPDIVLLDYFLPGKNGIELGIEIQKLSPNSKLVLLTMEKSFSVVEMAKETEFFGFISKSEEREDLLKH
jgi:DNA-binding NarL/FixJ family response regulator